VSREDDIKTLIDDLSPSSSEEEEQTEELEKEIHLEAQDIQTKGETKRNRNNRRNLTKPQLN